MSTFQHGMAMCSRAMNDCVKLQGVQNLFSFEMSKQLMCEKAICLKV